MRTRVKICGITNIEDGLAAADAGADAIGLVFYQRSPRAVSCEVGRQIAMALPPFVSVVALFVDEQPEQIRNVLSNVPIDWLQFHGSESAAECDRFDRPYMKALHMKPGARIQETFDAYPDAGAFLVDTYTPEVPGGSGESFDWSRLPETFARPVVLAGGLTPENVATAIGQVRPWGVDVSSGVEISRGRKDARKIEKFIEEAGRVQ